MVATACKPDEQNRLIVYRGTVCGMPAKNYAVLKLEATLTGTPVPRSLPHWIRTAYPRISKVTPDPARGLASVEALYAARLLQGRETTGLIDSYHWRQPFLAQFGSR